ncbi:hypothetical protein ACH5RR_036515 [Cinchona calisaya]|uniref:Uncharacterized protein n=1 Tax=Cinchona calisaya TaxID=153742 RepID=A0ABD2Y4W2_9GENT
MVRADARMEDGISGRRRMGGGGSNREKKEEGEDGSSREKDEERREKGWLGKWKAMRGSSGIGRGKGKGMIEKRIDRIMEEELRLENFI